MAGANAIRCGKLRLRTSTAISCNHESTIRRISGFLILSKCNQGAANSSNFTSPIPINEISPAAETKRVKVRTASERVKDCPMKKRAGQTRNSPIRRDELWIRNVIKSSVAIVTAQMMQTVSANESKLMRGKLAIYSAMA
jgi:hypothetical protein